jgi:hypothetical protein
MKHACSADVSKRTPVSWSFNVATAFYVSDGNSFTKNLILLEQAHLPQYKMPSQCSKFLFEKLTVAELVRKLLTIYGTRRSIVVFTTARHCSLFYTSWNQCTHFLYHFKINFPSMPSSLKWSLPFSFSDQSFHALLIFLIRATCPDESTLLDFIVLITFGEQ